MFKDVCDVIVVIISILMEIEIFRNLIIVRSNKYDKNKVNGNLKIARILIVAVIILYSIYGVIRNII